MFLRDRLFVLADLAQQGVRHVLRLGGGLVDFLRVVFQRREPALHVRRATAPVVADADPRAGQHRRYFGAQFFAGVLHAAEIPDAVLERGAVPAFVHHAHTALLDHALGGLMGFQLRLLVAVVVAPVRVPGRGGNPVRPSA